MKKVCPILFALLIIYELKLLINISGEEMEKTFKIMRDNEFWVKNDYKVVKESVFWLEKGALVKEGQPWVEQS